MFKPLALSFFCAASSLSSLTAVAQHAPTPLFAAGKYGATISARAEKADSRPETGIIGVFSPAENILRNMGSVTGYKSFLLSAERAELVALLRDAGPYTIFAPHNGAFGPLPAGPWAKLWDPIYRPQLRTMLQGLIVAGSLQEADLTPGRVLTTLAGTTLTVRRLGSRLALVDAHGKRAIITLTNQQASNGTVHALDAVLALP